MIYVIKKDGTKEPFDAAKIVRAVNKSAKRILYAFTAAEQDFICQFAKEQAESLHKEEIRIVLWKAPWTAYTRLSRKATGITGIIRWILFI